MSWTYHDESGKPIIRDGEAVCERYAARYRDGYYVVIDTETGDVVPPEPGHYKKHRDGYLWDYAAAYAAAGLNAGRPPMRHEGGC